MSKDYNLKISTDKTNFMALKGKHLVRSKIEIDGSILEQVKHFNYFKCELSLDGVPDLDQKINKEIPKNMRHYQKTYKENHTPPNEI